MQINILLLIGIVVIAFAGGYVFHMLDNRVTNTLKESRERNVKEDEKEEEKLPSKPADHSVLNVSLDPALKWHLELDGVSLEPNGLSPEQRARLVNVIVQIRPWIDGKSAPQAAQPAAPTAAPAPQPIRSNPSPSLPAIPLPNAEPPATPAPPSLSFARGLRSMLEGEVKDPNQLKALSIVSLIDEVLQKKLENSPLAGKKIRLEEGNIGEVVVYVGAVRYSGVDAVPDPQIKAIIQEAIKEWNSK